jgi:hypothetical protein
VETREVNPHRSYFNLLRKMTRKAFVHFVIKLFSNDYCTSRKVLFLFLVRALLSEGAMQRQAIGYFLE